jgi:cell division ATPase FtsA
MSVRTAQPDNLTGLVDKLSSPAYSTSVGLLRWAATMREHDVVVSSDLRNRRRTKGEKNMDFDAIKTWMKRLLP